MKPDELGREESRSRKKPARGAKPKKRAKKMKFRLLTRLHSPVHRRKHGQYDPPIDERGDRSPELPERK